MNQRTAKITVRIENIFPNAVRLTLFMGIHASNGFPEIPDDARGQLTIPGEGLRDFLQRLDPYVILMSKFVKPAQVEEIIGCTLDEVND